MITNILNTVKYFDPQIDLARSPCHRQLENTEIFIHLITFKNYTSIVSKTIATAALIFATSACLTPAGLGLLAINAVLALSPNIALIAIIIIEIAYAELIMYGKFIDYIHPRYIGLKKEEQIVTTLGGQHEFDRYPRVHPDFITEIHTDKNQYYDYYIDKFEPKHFPEQGITVGISPCKRPLICIHAKLKAKDQTVSQSDQSQSTVQTFFKRYAASNDNRWISGCKGKEIFPKVGSFDNQLEQIRQLKLGIHPSYVLVKAENLISFVKNFTDIDIIC